MEIYILRHGEAGQGFSDREKDALRPLTQVGKKEVKIISKALLELGLEFDAIAASPLKRAYQTAQIAADTLDFKQKDGKAGRDGVEQWDELKPDGNRIALYKKLSKFKTDDSVLLVGHEPFLGNMICDIILGYEQKARINLKKSGVARLAITSTHPKIEGELRYLLTPGILKRIGR